MILLNETERKAPDIIPGASIGFTAYFILCESEAVK